MKPKVGEKMGRYKVLRVEEYRVPSKRYKIGKPTWKVWARCKCGKENWIYAPNWGKKGLMCRKCSAATRVKHGMSATSLYHIWALMIQRCDNPKQTGYEYYGAMGVKVCERWRKFENFYADMGDRPPELQLDRINPNGNYEPGNVRWATRQENMKNRRRTKGWKLKKPRAKKLTFPNGASITFEGTDEVLEGETSEFVEQ